MVESSHPLAQRMLTQVWDRDTVLSTFNCALPIAVHQPLMHEFTIERSAGMSRRVEEGTVWFRGEGRSVYIDFYRMPEEPKEYLQDIRRDNCAEVPAEHQVAFRQGDEVRNAFWCTEHLADGSPINRLYGQILRPGTLLWMVCSHHLPKDHEWAMHVFRSIRG